MQFSPLAISFLCLSVGSASAFSRQAFVPAISTVQRSKEVVSQGVIGASAGYVSICKSGCMCAACTGSKTMLFSTAEPEAEVAAESEPEPEVPAEVEALDGIESSDEAHNAQRPAREKLQKKTKPAAKSIEEFEEGATISGKVKSITSYGAFVDIECVTDGLLHISQLSKGFVSDVKEFVEIGQEVSVRIINIDKAKNQIGLSLMTADEAAEDEQRKESRGQGGGGGGGGGGGRQDNGAAVNSLVEKGWDEEKFIEGTVVSTVDFGAFIKINVKDLNEEAEGQLDGLCHISSLSTGRVNDVSSIVNPDQKVQVRVKEINGRKVSLSMISSDEENAKVPGGVEVKLGAKDWKETFAKYQETAPAFKNGPVLTPRRKPRK